MKEALVRISASDEATANLIEEAIRGKAPAGTAIRFTHWDGPTEEAPVLTHQITLSVVLDEQ